MRRLQLKKRQLLEEIVAGVSASKSGLSLEQRRYFAHRLFEGMAVEDLEKIQAAEACALAGELLTAAMDRGPGNPEVRVFNPERAEHGWESAHTVIQVINDDMPFLVDSVLGELVRRELGVHQLLHPQIAIRRDGAGRLVELIPDAEEGAELESCMHIEIDRRASQATHIELQTTLLKILGDVRSAVDDWPQLRGSIEEVCRRLIVVSPSISENEREESLAFLRWIQDDHFTFLGYRFHRLRVQGETCFLHPSKDPGLGIRRRLTLETQVFGDQPVTAPTGRFLASDHLVSIAKSSHRATVHRPVQMDLITVKSFSPTGELEGVHRLLGLFTSRAYGLPASKIPLVHRKVRRVIKRIGYLPASHNDKLLRHLLEFYPRDELFQISEEDLYHFALRLMELQLRPRLALLVRQDEMDRFVSCMVFVPKEQHNTALRLRIQRILEEAYEAECAGYYTRVSELPLAQVRIILKTRPGRTPSVDTQALERLLVATAREWRDSFRSALADSLGEEEGLACWKRFQAAFPASYQEQFEAGEAVADIAAVEGVLASGRQAVRLYQRDGAAANRIRLRTFEWAVAAPLSQYLPILEDMGLQVIGEIPFEVRPEGSSNPVWVREFELLTEGIEVEPEVSEERFREAFQKIWDGEMESDGFNRLVLGAGLEWRQVTLLRAYCRYLLQTRIAFSQQYMAQTLVRNPEIATLLVELFMTLFDPAERLGAEPRAEAVRRRLGAALDQVASLDEDRILRRFLGLLEATLRTNYFQIQVSEKGEGAARELPEPKPYLSLKLDARKVPALPKPRPAFEIFVYSPRMEAVHLRGGKVARGGIRWSDRLEDYRTEILGLVKAQMVKNAVIIPVGAKGGFVVKQPPTSGRREDVLAEGIACYQTMMRGLLDLSDNLQGEKVIPPPRVVCRDGEDSYLVVAADKGTAAFSDIANKVAEDYGFWLGDAFASGGSVGYDHKKMGITARGAWTSVERHFRELDTDIARQPFTVIGVGDMSGDVFGNGMLLSEQIHLLAAFNHLHIFIDPDPDAATSFAERRRLFDLPRSSWGDYDRRLLSAGGEVFERSKKRLRISAEARRALDLQVSELTPNELIRAILSSPADLLWFGGIGTYVKGSSETDEQVGDRANDEVRIEARALKARVVGEGANLGVTQRGRIELARGGCLLNTDFIDNSGGVGTSDREVNIKIGLDEAVQEGALGLRERNELLREVSDEVAELVLRDNYLQTQAISLSLAEEEERREALVQLMLHLERSGRLDRKLEYLPDAETLANRGLTRPELAVLLAYGKMEVYEAILSSDLPDDRQLEGDLLRYFPEPLRRRFPEVLQRHRLRREIIATDITNSMVNRVGPTFVHRLVRDTGRSVSDIARAYTTARDVFKLRPIWSGIEKLDNRVSSDAQIELYQHTTRLLERMTLWFLRYGSQPLDVSAHVSEYRKAVSGLAAQLEGLLAPAGRVMLRRRRARLAKLRVPKKLAEQVSGLDFLASAGDIVRCARNSAADPARAGKVYFHFGERLGLDRLRRVASSLAGKSRWQKAGLGNLFNDFFHHQAELTLQALTAHGGRPKAAVEALLSGRSSALARVEGILEDLPLRAKPDFALLSAAEREVRRLCGGW